MRQTDYTEHYIRDKLNTKTATEIIKEYMSDIKDIDKKDFDKYTDNKITKNQIIYKEIRKFMNKSSMYK